jgi:hypothetical protein
MDECTRAASICGALANGDDLRERWSERNLLGNHRDSGIEDKLTLYRHACRSRALHEPINRLLQFSEQRARLP